MGNELTITEQKNMVSVLTANPLGNIIKPLTHEIHLFDSYVAGTTHIKDESVFDSIQKDDKLILKREPDNKFDENAILVLNEKNEKLGYIPEKDNVVFARLMDAGKYLMAKVRYNDPCGIFPRISIAIYLVDF